MNPIHHWNPITLQFTMHCISSAEKGQRHVSHLKLGRHHMQHWAKGEGWAEELLKPSELQYLEVILSFPYPECGWNTLCCKLSWTVLSGKRQIGLWEFYLKKHMLFVSTSRVFRSKWSVKIKPWQTFIFFLKHLYSRYNCPPLVPPF